MSRWCTKHLHERSYDELRIKDQELAVKAQTKGLGKAQVTTHTRIQAELAKRKAAIPKEHN